MFHDMGSFDQIIKRTAGQLNSLLREVFPSSTKDAIRKSFAYADGECDLIQDIIETKVDFYAAGLNIQIKTPNQNHKGALLKRFDQVIRDHQLRKVAEELIRDYSVCNNFILQWKVDGRELEYVTSINPARAEFGHGPGGEVLRVEIAEDVRRAITEARGDSRKMAAIKEMYPEKVVAAVLKGDLSYTLSNSDGEFWVVRTNARRFSGFARPTLASRFGDIVLRRLIIDGDFVVAFFLKRVIEHIKAGESPPSGKIVNLRELYPRKEEIKEYEKFFAATGQALRMFTNHTVSVEYPHPDPAIFNPLKYEKVEERILRWGGVVDVLMTGKGEGFSQGHLGARRFAAQGKRVREAVGEGFALMLLHPSLTTPLGVPTGSNVRISWDEQLLKDPKQVLDELSALQDRGILDHQSFHEAMGFDTDLVRERKQRDIKEKDIWLNTWEPRQGLTKAGRPEGGEERPAPKRRPRPDRS